MGGEMQYPAKDVVEKRRVVCISPFARDPGLAMQWRWCALWRFLLFSTSNPARDYHSQWSVTHISFKFFSQFRFRAVSWHSCGNWHITVDDRSRLLIYIYNLMVVFTVAKYKWLPKGITLNEHSYLCQAATRRRRRGRSVEFHWNCHGHCPWRTQAGRHGRRDPGATGLALHWDGLQAVAAWYRKGMSKSAWV